MEPASRDSLPPFASLQIKDGATELRVRAVFGKWFKCCLFTAIPAFFILLATLLSLIGVQATAESWPAWWMIAGEILCGLFLLFLVTLGICCAIIPSIKALIIFDGSKVRLEDSGAVYEIPVDQIRSIRHVKYPRTRLEFDPGGRPGRVLFWGFRNALQITTVEGTIEFFRCWGRPEVTWLTTNLHQLLFPRHEVPAVANVDPAKWGDLVVSTHSYGKERKVLFGSTLIILLIGLLAVAISGWYAFQGLSSRHWPTVQGRVTHSFFERKKGTDHAEIQYAYTVGGIAYSNDDFGVGRDPGDLPVKNLIAQHPDESPITVYYDPSRPARSVVIPGVGALHWLICGGCLILFLLPIRFVLRRTTPAQDALSRRYKIALPSIRDKVDPPPAILEWSMPEDAWRILNRSRRRSALFTLVRLPVITALLLWAAHHWLAPYCPPALPWRWINEFVMIIAGIQAVSLAALLLRSNRQAPAYWLTEKGLIGANFCRSAAWGNIASFTIQPDHRLRDRRVLSLHLKSGARSDLPLPIEMESAILGELSRRLIQSPCPARFSSIKAKDWLLGLILIAVLLGGMHLYAAHSARLNDLPLIPLLLFLGPGTWMTIFLRRRRAAPPLLAFAVGLNAIAMLCSMLIFILRLG